MAKVGDKIKILYMEGEPQYEVKEGRMMDEHKELQAVVFTGTMSEICAKLARETRGFDKAKASFSEWLFLRGREKRLDKLLAHLSIKRDKVVE